MGLALEEKAGAPWAVLPPGIHESTLKDLAAAFATNPTRRRQFCGLLLALSLLKSAGCARVYVDGSYITGKPEPGDYDACWDHTGVDPAKLDPVFFDFSMGRLNQKPKFAGEFFPAAAQADPAGRAFIDFFQVEKYSGTRKGIVAIDLGNEDIEDLMEVWR
jgi:hypothetical protein